jgi:hypothetical protein
MPWAAQADEDADDPMPWAAQADEDAEQRRVEQGRELQRDPGRALE